ncbi:MAG TPA: MFS transporter [Steroidobacteraceae bacterium]|nr:MFS transporter [Steroidobacteraceae bacterium]
MSLRKPHYAWIVLGVTFICLLVSAATRATPSILIVPLEKEFGWSRTTISMAISLNILLYGLIGPFAAGFINRYGPRRMMAASAVLIGLGTLATVTIRAPWQLFALWGVLVGVGTGIIAIVLGATVVQRWFYVHRGLALGMLTASAATGQLVFLPFLAKLVVDYGWRSSVITMAALALLMAPLALLLMRDRPQEKGLLPLGQPDDVAVPTPTVQNPFVAAISALTDASRSKEFWILAGSFFICGASTNGLIGTHLVPACMDHGMPEVQAASLLAVMGIFDLVGTTGSGWLSDRFDNRILLFAYYGLRGLSLLYLPYGFISEGHGLSIFAVFYGLDWIATVPPTVALARQAFGAEKTGLVFGWIMASHQIGAALAASVAGLIRTNEGSYDHAFIIAGSLCLITAIGVLFAGRGNKTGLVHQPG